MFSSVVLFDTRLVSFCYGHLILIDFVYSRLAGNPIVCNCSLKRQLENSTVKAKFEDLNKVVCANDPEKATVVDYLEALNCGKYLFEIVCKHYYCL